MDETRAVQLSIEMLLGLGCLLGYQVEASRAKNRPTRPTIERVQVVGQGDWVVLGVSEEASFDAMSATPELTCEGFEVEGERGRIAVPKGAKLRIVAIEGARRAPTDAIVRDGVARPRFSFELKPGTAIWLDVMLPALHAYRSGPEQPAAPVLIGGSKKSLRGAVEAQAFPGCWLMILFSSVAVGVFATLFGHHAIAWFGICSAAALMGFGWLALPSAQA